MSQPSWVDRVLGGVAADHANKHCSDLTRIEEILKAAGLPALVVENEALRARLDRVRGKILAPVPNPTPQKVRHG